MLKKFAWVSLASFTLTITGFAQSGVAATVSFDGRSYESVDWSAVDTVTDTATGTIGSTTVNLTTPRVGSNTIFTGDFSTDPAFDAVSFEGSGVLESLNIGGGVSGTTTFEFDREVSSLLVFVGLPNSNAGNRQLGRGVWDFDDALDLTFVDGEVAGERFLTIDPGNIVRTDASNGPGAHISGVFQIDGSFTSLSFLQSSTGGQDLTNITIAASFAQEVPEPLTVLGYGAVLAGGVFLKRKSQRKV